LSVTLITLLDVEELLRNKGEQNRHRFHRGDALEAYGTWPDPVTIISNGAYGVRGFHGDTTGPDWLVEWYRRYVEAWTQRASWATTLWFWNTEIGWATVHPLLDSAGWDYVETITWDKGIGHIGCRRSLRDDAVGKRSRSR
jgi:hypothetical protein